MTSPTNRLGVSSYQKRIPTGLTSKAYDKLLVLEFASESGDRTISVPVTVGRPGRMDRKVSDRGLAVSLARGFLQRLAAVSALPCA
ncbi:hypothetical protein J2Z50_005500 [Ensifer mexicanus]|nr:hypothetical protein [Sinorhizobium mexicanum]